MLNTRVSTYRHGALYVVESPGDRDALQRELRSLDPRLFLERQMTLTQELVWCVVLNGDSSEPPLTILEWRDERDRPIELASGIVERVRRMMSRDAHGLARDVARKNHEMIEQRRQAHTEAYREIALDMIPRIEGRVRPVLHRSPGLVASRRRERRDGRIR